MREERLSPFSHGLIQVRVAYIDADLPRRVSESQIYSFYPDGGYELDGEWKAAGLSVSDVRVTQHGMRESQIRDPDGYWLWFGQGSADVPCVREHEG